MKAIPKTTVPLEPPYYAVIFTSLRSAGDNAYEEMAVKMVELARVQAGFLGIESVRDASGVGITVSYWDSEESILAWKRNGQHQIAQRLGREQWYESFSAEVCKVERAYTFSRVKKSKSSSKNRSSVD